MKIAISTDGSVVSAHFGRCPEYTILNIEGDKLINKEVIENPGHQTGFLPEFLKGKGVGCIIAGGMGWRAQDLFMQSGIKTLLGLSGSIEEVISQLLNGTLKGGESLCQPGAGKDYGIPKADHIHEHKDCDKHK
ncbi:NifB/NifX family molybdenum-iron cluster-binding protein [bacterium]|nr:NifB/NifX family molybdenum-iron cluster-binding protein [bacterium]